MMQTVNLFHVKTHLSKLVDQIASGEENEFVISRIGIAEGEFTVPENIDGANEEIAKLFYKNSDCNAPQGVHDI
jgi:hypothetical protein